MPSDSIITEETYLRLREELERVGVVDFIPHSNPISNSYFSGQYFGSRLTLSTDHDRMTLCMCGFFERIIGAISRALSFNLSYQYAVTKGNHVCVWLYGKKLDEGILRILELQEKTEVIKTYPIFQD